MTTILPPLRLTGALALRDGRLDRRSVALADGRFTTGPLPAVDLSGYLLLPGIVDLHAALPVPAPADAAGLTRLDALSARHGLTTRCLTVPWSWEAPQLGPEAAAATLDALARHRPRAVTDLRPALAAEALMTDTAGPLLDLVRGAGVGLVWFTNRAEAARAAGDASPEAQAALDRVLANARQMPRHLCQLAEAFDALGVAYGSAGDTSAEQREHHSMIGARLCLDPGTTRVAAAARAVGDPVLVTAEAPPGGPAPGPRLAALVQGGLCDALVAGADPAAPLRTAFRLADLGLLPFERAWRLVSEIPARILRLPDRGVIAPGRRADLVVVEATTRQVEATIAGGRLGFLAGEAARRFHAAGSPEPLAAE